MLGSPIVLICGFIELNCDNISAASSLDAQKKYGNKKQITIKENSHLSFNVYLRYM
jgi:hypothetical protein